MRIAVTGGQGLMGRALCAYAAAKGHEITSIDNRPPDADTPPTEGVTPVVADVTDYEQFLAAIEGCDSLVHLAAYPTPSGRPPHVVHNANVIGSYNALCAGVEAGMRRLCLASSINATGAAYSRSPRYDYFPLDELHPTYNEDPYSLSKWVGEAQGDSVARRYDDLAISSLRLHRLIPDRATVRAMEPGDGAARRDLWGYTTLEAAARAALAALTVSWTGHEAFYIVAADTLVDVPTAELCERYYPDVPIRETLTSRAGLFSTAKAERLLGWTHDA
jgi:nucleoside-diphosphate-sugar epimerase